MFSKSWSVMTKGLKEVKDTLKLDLKSVKEVKDTVKLHLVKSLKEVKGKSADVDLENVVQRVAAPFIIIVGIWAFSSHTSNKLLVVSEEQTDHLRAIRCVLDKSYGVEEEKQIVGEEKEKEKNRDLPSLQLLDEQKLVFRKVVNAWKDKLVNAWEEPNISARDYAKIVYGTF